MGVQAYPVNSQVYPATLDGRLDPAVGRWLWLVKWLLVIPHLIVLYFLWIATTVLTIIAGFAILFTGRYPRALFGFNVGVMRWTWRVTFYAIGGFATDRYPPFTLAHDPSYPADFDVEYPGHLSRGLVLVKWWLLAIPQYLIVGLFVSGFAWGGSWGLIGVLALFAAIALLFTGRYPEQMFDFVMGLNRWCYRVLAYAALMRDEYPPFRLDLGGMDPGHTMAAIPAGAAPPAAFQPPVPEPAVPEPAAPGSAAPGATAPEPAAPRPPAGPPPAGQGPAAEPSAAPPESPESPETT